MQPDLNPDPKASNHYLTSYKSESLAHEFEQDLEAKQKQGMMGTGEGAHAPSGLSAIFNHVIMINKRKPICRE